MLKARPKTSDVAQPIEGVLFLGVNRKMEQEIAHSLGDSLFGSKREVMFLDMNEYRTAGSLKRLLGAKDSLHPSRLVSMLSSKKPTLIFIEQIEKAHPQILQLFFQFLNDGFFIDAKGKKIILRQVVLVATSEFGSEMIKRGREEKIGKEVLRKKVIAASIKKRIFQPEFLSRFEQVLIA
jgi:ATP-dependent Clp protease ATP-binding subunit ClpA